MNKSKVSEYGYADMHIHILPDVDDGSDGLKTSLAMLNTAYNEGTRMMVCTSHYHPRRCRASTSKIIEVYKQFVESAKTLHPDMKLVYGREVYYSSDALEALENEKKLLIGNTRYVLVEFSPAVREEELIKSLNNVMQLGLTPIVAHIERYACVVDDWEIAYDVKDMGMLIQVNTDSVVGGLGRNVKKAIKHMMSERLVDLVGSDAHNNDSRPPHMQECADYIRKKFGDDYAKKILHDNPKAVIGGHYI